MQFQFEGQIYRIIFHHSVPTDWNYHLRHEVELGKENGGIRLLCRECEARIGRPVVLSNLGQPQARHTQCQIQIEDREAIQDRQWVSVLEGESRLNFAAGDRFTREGGRLAALRAAISSPRDVRGGQSSYLSERWPDFRETAMNTYLNRKVRRQDGVTA